MKKSFILIGIFVLSAVCFQACKDNSEKLLDTAKTMQIYGRQYHLASGVIWRNPPDINVLPVPYIYEDTYTNSAGVVVTDKVAGYTAGSQTTKTGNFMLSLYADGLIFNEALQTTGGRGALVCFHLATESLTELTPGKYVYNAQKIPGTFQAYLSSDYNSAEGFVSGVPTKPASITQGEISIEKNTEDEYTVTFNCQTSFGAPASGSYRGKMQKGVIPLLPSASYVDVPLHGLFDKVEVSVNIVGQPPRVETEFDVKHGKAFLSSAFGVTQAAESRGFDIMDIALVWDNAKKSFYFEAPIRMRSLLGHSSQYNFPSRTVYMKAPASFTEADFENLSSEFFNFDIEEQKVEFPIENFTAGYVFFQTGKGIKGAMHIKGFTPPDKVTEVIIPNFATRTRPINPKLIIDIKSPSNFVSPKLR